MKQKIKIIHSFSTKPLENKSIYGVERLHHLISDIWIYTLSAAYVRREGFDIELHTDQLGALLLSKAPYTKIHTTLDNIPDTVHPRFWAAGKIYALEAAGDNTVHIDGDVFIKDAKLLNIEDKDFIVQSIEPISYSKMGELNKIDPKFGDFCVEHGFDPYISQQFNTGVIGIMNPELRNKYIEAYKNFVNDASIRFKKQLDNEYCTPDLFAELQQFTTISKEYDGVCLLGDKLIAPKGYLHLVTNAKYTEIIMNKVKKTLELYFPELYKETLKLCRRI